MSDLRLVEWFWTFQGEGANWGRRAFFVRLPFCNLKCSWCDTEFNKYVTVSESDFMKAAIQEPSRFSVLTGGEPAMNKQTPRIIELLKSEKFELAIETNGCFPIPERIDFVTISPKRDANYEVHPDATVRADEFKFVVDDEFDFDVARKIDDQTKNWAIRLTLSPEFNNFKANISKIENFLKKNPRWRISLQTHKWMGVR